MLFNSFPFLLGFLPASLALHALAARHAPGLRPALLALLSLAFYAWWDVRFLPLLAVSILLNWAVARLFAARTERRWLIALAVVLNLAVLALFKYAGFLAATATWLGVPVTAPAFALPLGISFFTFHHIMYLSDLRAGQAPRLSLTNYALYIGFFPQVLAGPLVRWREILPQLSAPPYGPGWERRASMGLALLTIGLVKKITLADPIAAIGAPGYLAAAQGLPVGRAEAWMALLSFPFQVYFDFSGYTDMALGVALLFGITLPQNFDAPFRATSLPDLWRRWHMTLSRFLRDYLYIPLGGSRRGAAVQLAALFATMTLGGLWHGAGWNFVVWGALHGVGLAVAIAWRNARLPMHPALGWALTMAFFWLALVLFRAGGFEAAWRVLEGLWAGPVTGQPFRWRTFLAAALVSTLGPTSWAAVQRMPANRLVGALTGLVLALMLFKVGDEGAYEFVYFQF